MDVEDGNDSEDSDFVPGAEEEDDQVDAELEEEEPKKSPDIVITGARKTKVDALWAELNGLPDPSLAASGDAATTDGGKKKKTAKKSSASKKVSSMLTSIFGKKVAANIISKVAVTKKKEGSAVKTGKALVAPKKIEITETKKYAGKAITVTRKVLEGSKEEAAAVAEQEKAKKIKPLANVLAQLEEPKQLNTVSKSSLDWDKFKEVEGLEDELAAVTKEGVGYIAKQDFLQRVDHRQFEQERDMRVNASAKKKA